MKNYLILIIIIVSSCVNQNDEYKEINKLFKENDSLSKEVEKNFQESEKYRKELENSGSYKFDPTDTLNY